LSSQGVATVGLDLDETTVIDSKTAETDNVLSSSMIHGKLGDTLIATNLEESNVQQEPTLTSKSSAKPSYIEAVAAKNAGSLSSHLIVDSNGISNANASIDSWCLSIICSR
jgi:hypothetical protein